jgi:hypothetical protein
MNFIAWSVGNAVGKHMLLTHNPPSIHSHNSSR